MGAAPGVNGLIGIAYDKEIAASSAQQPRNVVLPLADVLKLVHQHILHAVLPPFEHLLVVLQKVKGEIDQVVEVEAEAFLLFVKIAEEDFLVSVARGREIGTELFVIEQIEVIHIVYGERLLHFNHVLRLLDGRVAQGELHILEDLQEDLGSVVVIVDDDEILGESEEMRLLFQKLHAEGMERTDIAQIHIRQHLSDTTFHLVRRTVGEGGTKNIPGRNADGVDQVAIARSKGTSLACSCSGDDSDGAFRQLHSLPLLVVQSFQIFLSRFHRLFVYQREEFVGCIDLVGSFKDLRGGHGGDASVDLLQRVEASVVKHAFAESEEEVLAVVRRNAQLPFSLFLRCRKLKRGKSILPKLLELFQDEIGCLLTILRICPEIDALQTCIGVMGQIGFHVIDQSVLLAQRDIQTIVHARASENIVEQEKRIALLIKHVADAASDHHVRLMRGFMLLRHRSRHFVGNDALTFFGKKINSLRETLCHRDDLVKAIPSHRKEEKSGRCIVAMKEIEPFHSIKRQQRTFVAEDIMPQRMSLVKNVLEFVEDKLCR